MANPKKRILRGFRIDEISGVDNPAQEGARALIMKRADQKPGQPKEIDLEELAKKLAPLLVNKGDIMPDDIKELQKKLKKAEAINALSTDERTHYDGLTEGGDQDEFLGKSADERKAIITKAQNTDENPVVYTTAEGIEIRKSEGAIVVALAKQADILSKENADLRKARDEDTLTKRAETELSHFPGDVKTRVAILKQVESITDETTRKSALQSLRSQNDQMGKAFAAYGSIGEPETGSPEDQLEKLATKRSEDKDESYPVAYAKILKSDKGQELYAQTLTVN